MIDNPEHGMLPEGWEWRELGDVAEINPSKKEVSKLSDNLEVSFLEENLSKRIVIMMFYVLIQKAFREKLIA